MKKVLCFILSIIMVLGMAQAAFAVSEETALETGDRHISFSNGYIGYCLDASISGADAGDVYTDEKDTSFARNNFTDSDISQQLKIFFTQCFESIYARGDDGSYYVLDTNCVQSVVWHYSDNYWMNPNSAEGKLISQVDSYTGEYIPDNCYSRTLENGDTITFYFTVLTPANTSRQAYFAYAFGVERPHEHEPGVDWETDGDSHWHECECGERFDEEEHTGGEPDCENKAVCDECGEPYGETDSDNHTGGEELRGAKEPTTEEEGYSGDKHCGGCGELLEKGEPLPKIHEHDPDEDWMTDGDSHWHECDCGERFDEDEHTGGEPDCENKAVCDECGEPYGETDPDNHTGEEELRGAKEPTTEEEGYSGDKHCGGCGELLEKGEPLPKIHEHEPGDWITDEDSHWRECDCEEKLDEGDHDYEDGECIVCEKEEPKDLPTTPDTGDNSMLVMWILLTVVSLAGFVWVAYRKKNMI